MTTPRSQTRTCYFGILFAVLIGAFGSDAVMAQSSVRPPEGNQASVPGGTLGTRSDSDLWRQIRQGEAGQVSIPDTKAAVLVQSDGESFRAFRNGPLASVGAQAIVGVILFLILFFVMRGRIEIESGPGKSTVTRFNFFERFVHWLTAGPFIILALTGLNMLYGKYLLLPVMGPEAFGALTYYGKLAHNYLGFAFMIGVVLMLLMWIKDNLPTWLDVKWLAAGGGMLSRHSHPTARRFNAGQKLIFWLVIISGLSLSASGLALLYPFELAMFAGTFEIMNMVGFSLPTELTPLQETQLALLWHSIVALVAILAIIGHIYIGTIGMEGALGAVTSGEVDENWAREHHSLWYEKISGKKD